MVWLKTPVEETDDDGKRRMIGGRFERHCYAASAPADLEFLTSEEFDQVAIRPRDEGDLSGRHIGALPPHDHPHVDLAMETACSAPTARPCFALALGWRPPRAIQPIAILKTHADRSRSGMLCVRRWTNFL